MVRFTQKGYEKTKKDYEDLQQSRIAAVEDLQKARAMGDLSENGYYKAARMKLSSIDQNLRIYSSNLKNAVILENTKPEIVDIGSSVALFDGEKEYKYSIVGDLEADPKLYKISLLSPIGKAIKNKKVNDTVIVKTPSGNKTYNIVNIF